MNCFDGKMARLIKHSVILIMLVSIVVLAGCQSGTSTVLRYKYTAGDAEKVRFTAFSENKVWVEMPNKQPTKPQMNVRLIEVVMQREVESVEPGGSAIVKVTLEEVKISVKVDVSKKQSERVYHSTAAGTQSDFPEDAQLAGASYRIKIAADTTVEEILDIDQLKKDLGINAANMGVVGNIIGTDSIKRMHQQDFVMQSPATVNAGQVYASNVSLPHPMIKAQAVKKIFTVDEKISENAAGQVKVAVAGDALYVLPEGIEAPGELNDFGQIMIKDKSDMQEFAINGVGLFDAGKVRQSNTAIDCLLVLDGDKLGFGGKQNQDTKGKAGFMFTSVNLAETFEVME